MKRIVLIHAAILLLFAGSFSCQNKEQDFLDEETDFYYTDIGEKEYFIVRKDKVILKCKSEAEAKALAKQKIFLSAYTIAYDESSSWVIGTIDPEKTKLNDLLQKSEVVSATYGLEYVDGALQYPTDRISVTFKKGQTPESVLDAIGLTENVEAIELFDSWSDLYLITLNIKLSDILLTSRILFESELCVSAEPSFFLELKHPNPNI